MFGIPLFETIDQSRSAKTFHAPNDRETFETFTPEWSSFVEGISTSVNVGRFFPAGRWIPQTGTFDNQLHCADFSCQQKIFRNFMEAANHPNLSRIYTWRGRSRPATFKSAVRLTVCELPVWNWWPSYRRCIILIPPEFRWQISPFYLSMKNIFDVVQDYRRLEKSNRVRCLLQRWLTGGTCPYFPALALPPPLLRSLQYIEISLPCISLYFLSLLISMTIVDFYDY